MRYKLILVFFLFELCSFAQVGIGVRMPDRSTMLDIKSDSAGVLIPNVKLESTTSMMPIKSSSTGLPTSLLVYNISTAGIAPNDVEPGFYYWGEDASWHKLATIGDIGVDITNDSVKVIRGLTPQEDSLIIYDSNNGRVSVSLDSINRLTKLSVNSSNDSLLYTDELGRTTSILMTYNDNMYLNSSKDTLFLKDSRDSILSVELTDFNTSNDSMYTSHNGINDSLYLRDSQGNLVGESLDSLNILTTLSYDTISGLLSYQDESGVVNQFGTFVLDSVSFYNNKLYVFDSRGHIDSTNISGVNVTNDSLKVVRGLTPQEDSLVIYDSNNDSVSVSLDSINLLTSLSFDSTTRSLTYHPEYGADAVLDLSILNTTNDSLYLNSSNDTLLLKDSRGIILSVALTDLNTLNDSLYASRTGINDSLYLRDAQGNLVGESLDSMNLLTSLSFDSTTRSLTYHPEYGADAVLDLSILNTTNDSLYLNSSNDTLLLKDSRGIILSVALTDLNTLNDSLYASRTGINDSLYLRDSQGNLVGESLDSMNLLTSLSFDSTTRSLTYHPEYGADAVLDLSILNTTNDSLYLNSSNDTLLLKDSRGIILSVALTDLNTLNDSLYASRTGINDSLYLRDSQGNLVGESLDSMNLLTILSFDATTSKLTYQPEYGNDSILDLSILNTLNDSLYASRTGINDSLYLRDSQGNLVGESLDSMNLLTILSFDATTSKLTYQPEYGNDSILDLSILNTLNDSLYASRTGINDSLYLRDSQGNLVGESLDSMNLLTILSFDATTSKLTYQPEYGNDSILDLSILNTLNDSLYASRTGINDSLYLRDSQGNLVGESLDSMNLLTILSFDATTSKLTYQPEYGNDSILDLSILNTLNDSLYASRTGINDSLYLRDSQGNLVGESLDSMNLLTILSFDATTSKLTYQPEYGNDSILDLSILNTLNDSLYASRTGINDSLYLRDSQGNLVGESLDSMNLLTILSFDATTSKLTYQPEYGNDSILDLSILNTLNDSLYASRTGINDSLYLRDSQGNLVGESLDSMNLLTILSFDATTSKLTYQPEYGNDSILDLSILNTLNDSLYASRTGINDSLYLRDSQGNLVGESLDSMNLLTILSFDATTSKLTYQPEYGNDSILDLSILNTLNDSLYASRTGINDSLYLRDSQGNLVGESLDSMNLLTILSFDATTSKLTYQPEYGNDSILDLSILNTLNDSLYASRTGINDSLYLRDSQGNLVGESLDSMNLLTILSFDATTSKLTYQPEYGNDSILDLSILNTLNDSLYASRTGINDSLYLRDSQGNLVGESLDSMNLLTILSFDATTSKLTYQPEYGNDSILDLSILNTLNDSLYASRTGINDSLYLRDSQGNLVGESLDSMNLLTILSFDATTSKLTYQPEYGNDSILDLSILNTLNDSLYASRTGINDSLYLRDSQGNLVGESLDSMNLLTILSFDATTSKLTYQPEYGNDSILDLSILNTLNDSLYASRTGINDSLYLRDSQGNLVGESLDSMNLLTILSFDATTSKLTYQPEYGNDSILDLSILNTLNDSLYASRTGINDSLYLRDSQGNLVGESLDSMNLLTILSFDATTSKLTYQPEYGNDSILDLSILNTLNDSLYASRTGINDSLYLRDSQGNLVGESLDSMNLLTILSFDATTSKLTYQPEYGNDSILDLSILNTTNDSLYLNSSNDTLLLKDSRGSILMVSLDSLKNPLYKRGTQSVATNNTDSVYITGSLGVGTDTAMTMLDVNGDVRIQKVNDGLITDSLLVIDSLGVVKKVSQLKPLNEVERATGETWVNDSIIYTVTLQYVKTTAGTTFYLDGTQAGETPSVVIANDFIGKLIGVRVINDVTNGISSEVSDFATTSSELTMGSGSSLYVTFDPGTYWITLQYTKQ